MKPFIEVKGASYAQYLINVLQISSFKATTSKCILMMVNGEAIDLDENYESVCKKIKEALDYDHSI